MDLVNFPQKEMSNFLSFRLLHFFFFNFSFRLCTLCCIIKSISKASVLGSGELCQASFMINHWDNQRINRERWWRLFAALRAANVEAAGVMRHARKVAGVERIGLLSQLCAPAPNTGVALSYFVAGLSSANWARRARLRQNVSFSSFFRGSERASQEN